MPTPDGQGTERWATTEHYFQAQKFIGTAPSVALAIRATTRPRAAFTLARAHADAVRTDWADVRDDVMLTACRAKFEQHPSLRRLLLSTAPRALVEHTTADAYWGDGGDGSGLNRLGATLMRVRDEAQAATGPQPAAPAVGKPRLCMDGPSRVAAAAHVAREVAAQAVRWACAEAACDTVCGFPQASEALAVQQPQTARQPRQAQWPPRQPRQAQWRPRLDTIVEADEGAAAAAEAAAEAGARREARRRRLARRHREALHTGAFEQRAELWHPDDGFDVTRDVGCVPTARAGVHSMVRTLQQQDGAGVPADELEAAIREMWAAEDAAVTAVEAAGGRVPGPEVDTERAAAEGLDPRIVQQLREGMRFSVEVLPAAHSGENYGSVRANLLRYIRELTRLLRKFKLLPVRRQPWLLQNQGFVVTQEGAKVRLVVDATATGLNENLAVGLFGLPSVEDFVSLGHEGDVGRKDDVADMFLSFRLHPSQWTLCGIRNELTGQDYVYPWLSFGVAESPLIAHRVMTAAQAAADVDLEREGLKPRAGDVAPVSEAEAEAAVVEVLQRADDEGATLAHEWQRSPAAAARLRHLTADAVRRLVGVINRDLARRRLDANVVYVDDVAYVGHGRDISRAAEVIRRKLRALGLDFRDEKTEGPDPRMVFIGVGADLHATHLYVEERKQVSLRGALQAMQEARQQGRQLRMDEVRRVVGQLSFSSVAFSAGHTYLRRMWDELQTFPAAALRRGSRVRFAPSDAFWDDVAWWCHALEDPAARRLTPRFGTGRLGFWRGESELADVIMATDSSQFAWGYVLYRAGFIPIDLVADVSLDDVEAGVLGDEGVGTSGLQVPPPMAVPGAAGERGGVAHASILDAQHRDEAMRRLRAARVSVDRGRRYRGRWQGETIPLSINWKELRTVVLACRRHGAEWRGKRVLVRVDNQAALSYVNRGYGRAQHLTRLGRQIKSLAARHGFELHATYVNTKFNAIPDGLSRLTLKVTSPDWMFARPEFALLQDEFGPFFADMMACRDGSNAQLPRYFTEHDDAYSVDIRGRVTWWNPPWDLVQRTLRHVLAVRAADICGESANPHSSARAESDSAIDSSRVAIDSSRLTACADLFSFDSPASQAGGRSTQRPSTEAVIVLPRRAWEQAGRLQRRFRVVREYPAGTPLFTAPDFAAPDAGIEGLPESQYETTSPAAPATSPVRWSPRAARFPTVVVVTMGLARSRGYA